MTGLAHTHFVFLWVTAKKTFRAMCGHMVKKGEEYLVFNDSFAYNRYHTSTCAACVKAKRVGEPLAVGVEVGVGNGASTAS